MVRTFFCITLLFVFSLVLINKAHADNAEVLPKGVFQTDVNSKLYFTIKEKFDQDGEEEKLAHDYNTTLDSEIFPDLGLLELAFGMPAGSANIGTSNVNFKYYFSVVNISFMYGITEKLSAGILLPYYWAKNEIDSSLDTTNATIGKSAIGVNFGAPLVPLAGGGPFGDAVPLEKGDVIDLLSDGLDANGDGTADTPGFGYEEFDTWSDNGIGDLTAGIKYQYLKTEDWRLAFTSGIIFPTGDIDNTDILQDTAADRGKGAYGLILHLHNDYTAIKNLLLNTTLRYNLYLPADETLRITSDVNIPITTDKEEVKRDLGDQIEVEVSGRYTLTKGLNLTLLYNYTHLLKTNVSGDKGFAYEALEEETDGTRHFYIIGFSYSTIPLYMEKKFPMPLTASVAYRDLFAGSNNTSKNKAILLGLSAYF
jgi:hypothetical protein